MTKLECPTELVHVCIAVTGPYIVGQLIGEETYLLEGEPENRVKGAFGEDGAADQRRVYGERVHAGDSVCGR